VAIPKPTNSISVGTCTSPLEPDESFRNPVEQLSQRRRESDTDHPTDDSEDQPLASNESDERRLRQPGGLQRGQRFSLLIDDESQQVRCQRDAPQ
jgi:hypothetical protein